jgi:diaminopimelate epimerase
MKVEFYKYHGAGNDFVMIDCRKHDESLFDQKRVEFLCDRHLGIGADGLILLLSDKKSDFRMKYFNSDGVEGSMCGNGGRCIVAFAREMNLIRETATFTGIDGIHAANILGPEKVSLKMIDVEKVEKLEDGYLINTGSPHFVTFRDKINEIDVYNEGGKIRHQARFDDSGANVNFVETITKNTFRMRTFERGVENETLACGTGSVAAAISSYYREKPDKCSYTIEAPGGTLFIRFTAGQNGGFSDIWLEGPVKFVFKGQIEIL